MAFSDLMLESLFAEVWTREELSMRDRRLILFGAIGALGERDTFGTLEAFRAHVRGNELVERVVEHGIREVSYASGGDDLHLRYDALRGGLEVVTRLSPAPPVLTVPTVP